MCLVGHAGNTLVLFVLLQALGLARAGGANGELILWALVFGLAQDLDGITLAFRKRLYFGSSLWAHRGIGHTLVGCAALTALYGGTHLHDPPLRVAGALALLIPLHFLHVGLDLLTYSERQGIRALWPLSGRRFGYLGKIRWYSVTVIFLSVLYAALYPLAAYAGPGVVVLLCVTWLMLQGAFVWSSSPAVSRDAGTWDAFERRFVPGPAYRAISRALSPFRTFWKSAYRDATSGR